MIKSGWSDVELAEKLGVSPVAIQQWLHGDSPPRLANARRLADLFDVDVEELLCPVNLDPIIITVLKLLPPTGQWSRREQARWLQLLASALNVVYDSDDDVSEIVLRLNDP